jgi:hypothetical protein
MHTFAISHGLSLTSSSAETLATMLDSCYQLRSSCLSGVAEGDREYLLREYVFLLLWLTRESVSLTYLGLADSALVKQKLDNFSQHCKALANVTVGDDKEELLVSHAACNDPCPGTPSSPEPLMQSEYMQENSGFRRLISSALSTGFAPAGETDYQFPI